MAKVPSEIEISKLLALHHQHLVAHQYLFLLKHVGDPTSSLHYIRLRISIDAGMRSSYRRYHIREIPLIQWKSGLEMKEEVSGPREGLG
jgi:hypothetical protein